MRRLITIPLRRCSLPFAATIAGDRLTAPLGPLRQGGTRCAEHMENPGFETTRLATNVYGIFVVDDVAIAALYDLQFSEPIIRFIHVLQQHRFVL